MAFRRFLFFVLTALIFGCSEPSEGPPEDVLTKEVFTQVMIDVQLIEGMKIHRLGPKREKNPDMELLYGVVLEEHEIDKEVFLKTYNYYKSRPEEMEIIYEQVLDSLSKLDAEVKKDYGKSRSVELRKAEREE